MLVSAISATHNQNLRLVNYGFINSRGGDSGTDTINVPSIATPTNNNEGEDFNSINEWKAFCHKQIANGKLDIIA